MKTAIRIGFDALTDLSAVGLPREESEDFERAWKGALSGLAEALGLDDVRAVRHRGEATETPISEDDDVETTLWQAAHDLCDRDAKAPLGDRWQWSKPSASRVTSLRRALRLPLAAEETA